MEIKCHSVVDYLDGLRLHFVHVISPPDPTVMSGEQNAQQNIVY